MTGIELSLERNDETILLSRLQPATGFMRLEGRHGFGVPPTTVVIDSSASDGGLWRRTRREVRPVDLPMCVYGVDRADVELNLRKLTRILRESDDLVSARLVATYPGGERRYLSVHYGGGTDPQYGPSGDSRGGVECTVYLSLIAAKPFWVSEEVESYNISAANQGRGLIKGVSLSKLRLSSSQTIGEIIVTNPGDVEAFPVWTVTAPGDSFKATLGTRELFYDEEIATGSIILSAVDKTVVDDAGVDKFENLAPGPKFFAIPPGQSTIAVEVPGTDSNTLVSLNFNPRYEMVYG